MSAPLQKQFPLRRTDEYYGIVDPPTSVTLRRAGEADNLARAKFIAELRTEASRLIELGVKSLSPFYSSFCTDYLWHLHYGNPHPMKKVIDDRSHRFFWVRDYLHCTISRFEIQLTLAASNLVDENKRPMFAFTDGHIDDYPALDFGETSLSTWEEEIHEKVLEMNPGWRDEPEKLCALIVQENHLEGLEDIRGPVTESIFSKSENYLYSLLEEINRAVFSGIGKIRAEIVEDGPRKGSAEGFNLYIPKNNWNPNNLGYIGTRENGRQEIRIVVKRDKSEYWDTDINGVVDGLQQAIIWWKECGEFTEEERIKHEDDEIRARLEKEGKDLLAEKRSAL